MRRLCSLILSLCLLTEAFAGTVTLDGNANARSSANFRGDNVEDVLTKGTEGDVIERVEMPSGNFALHIKITKLGPGGKYTNLKEGSLTWVYYHLNPKVRVIELYDDDHKRVSNPAEGKWAIVLKDHRIAHQNRASKPVGQTECVGCNAAKTTNTPLQNNEATVKDQINSLNQMETAQSPPPPAAPLSQAPPPVIPPAPRQTVVTQPPQPKPQPAPPPVTPPPPVVQPALAQPHPPAQSSANVPELNIAAEEAKTFAYLKYEKQVGQTKAKEDVIEKIAATLPEVCARDHVDIPFALLIMKHESHFKKDAESGAGAQGLMQIMPGTQKTYAKGKDIFDEKVNISAGVDFLRDLGKKAAAHIESHPGDLARVYPLLKRKPSEPPPTIEDAIKIETIIGYSCGEGCLDKFLSGKKHGVPRETRGYIKSMDKTRDEYAAVLDKTGFVLTASNPETKTVNTD